MTNKDFLSSMAAQTGMKKAEVQRLVQFLTATLAENMEDGDTTAIQGFGTFEMKKKLERIVVNPPPASGNSCPPDRQFPSRPAPHLK